jgi:hypothetical protein
MRKGDNGSTYLVIDNGVQFRTIAKVMTQMGYKMNHATARTRCTAAIRKLLASFLKEVQSSHTNTITVDQLMLDKEVHNTLSEILFEAFQQELNEKETNVTND